MSFFFTLQALPASDSVGKCGGLCAAVCLFDGTCLQYARDQYLADHLPLNKSCRTLDGDADAVHDAHVLFLTAGDQRAVLAGDILPSYNKREHLVDDALDLGRNGIPVDRHGEDDGIRFQYGRSDGIEIVVEGTGLARLVL